MLKKNKVLILISVFVLMFSIFTLSACSNKAANKSKLKLYDANGLPLTKEAALKLWCGTWSDGHNHGVYVNKINDDGWLSVMEFVKKDKTPRDSFMNWGSEYDVNTKTLKLIHPLSSKRTIYYKFINTNTFKTNTFNHEETYTRVVE